MIKRNCNECRANDINAVRLPYCALGYKTEFVDIRDLDGNFYGNSIKPLEECPKPKTWTEYFNAAERIESDNIKNEIIEHMNFTNRVKPKQINNDEKQIDILGNDVICPFCNEHDFDLVGLKYHLENYCEVYKSTKSPIR